MSESHQVATDLGLKVDQVEIVDGNVRAVVHEKWINFVLSKLQIPTDSTEAKWPEWHGEDSVAFGAVSKPWIRLQIHAIKIPPNGCIRVPPLASSGFVHHQNFFQYLGAIALQNYKQLWKEAYRKANPLQNQLQKKELEKFEDIPLRQILWRIYGCPFVNTAQTGESDVQNGDPKPQIIHGNLVPVLFCVCAPKFTYLVQQSVHHTLQQCVTFSPAMLTNSYAKPLYIVYQLLQIVDLFHRHGVICGNIDLTDFAFQEDLWVRFQGPRWSQIIPCDPVEVPPKEEKDERSLSYFEQFLEEVPLTNLKGLAVKSLSEISAAWVVGKISNFDYLMVLNYLAGRRMNNPNFHPVLPWVCDFSSKDGGFRDLSKSKFRLNKGDQQLDRMYESASLPPVDQDIESKQTKHTPHHITGMLADITYYVYKSRRTPISLLCTHVRRRWVPEEYPSSMQRMQEWTPDECIPEFFCSPEIFKSIHKDLPDLELPAWCQDEEDFVNWHRSVLESDKVSEKLHKWIDITFGNKLSGSAAKKAMNVFLPLMDNHTHPMANGVVQLFHVPHPKKLTPSPYMALDAPNIPRTKMEALAGGEVKNTSGQNGFEVSMADIASDVLVTNEDAAASNIPAQMDQTNSKQSEIADATQTFDVSVESVDSSMETVDNMTTTNRLSAGPDVLQLFTGEDNLGIKNPIKKLPFFRVKSDPAEKTETRPEDAVIKLPDGYEPLAALFQVENLYSFTSKSLHGVPSYSKQAETEADFEKLVERDMLALGCTIAELFLASKVRAHHPRLPLEERKKLILRTLATDWMEVPRPCRDILQLLLKIEPSSTKLCHPVQPFTCNFLLSPYAEVISFPTYFSPLHQLAKELSEADAAIAQLYCLIPMDTSLKPEINALKRRKVHTARRWMPEVLSDVSEEGKEILLLYLLDLFKNQETGIFALLLLFNKLSQYLGPQKSAKHCLPIIKSIFEMDHSTSHFILLYHRPFLSQLLVRLGNRTFLRHLAHYIIAATNGLKDCPVHSSEDEPWIQNCSSQNSGGDSDSFTSPFAGKKDLSYEEDVFNLTEMNQSEESAKQYLDEQPSDDEDVSLSEEEQSESISLESLPLNPESTSSSSLPFINDPINNGEGCSGDLERTSLEEENDEASATSNDQEEDGESSGESRTSLDEERNEERSSLENRSSEGSKRNGGSAIDGPQQSPSVVSNLSSEIEKDAQDQKETGDRRERTLTPDLFQARHNSIFYPVSTLSDLPMNVSLSEVACQSVSWLAERMGPSLTGLYLTGQLLEALTKCYTGSHLMDHPQSDCTADVSDVYLNGDSYAEGVLHCLMDIVELYGDEFIFQQFIPFIEVNVSSVKKRIFQKHEASLVASMALLESIIQHITEKQLMYNKKVITKKILYPVINLLSSLDHVFPSGARARNSLCRKLVAVITTLALRLGREMARNELKELLNYFFLSFDVVSGSSLLDSAQSRRISNQSTDSDDFYCEIKKDSLTDQYRIGTPTKLEDLKGEDGSVKSSPGWSPGLTGIAEGSVSNDSKVNHEAMLQLESVFTPEMAYIAYVPLCRLIGSIHLENTTPNHDLIWKLYNNHEKVVSSKADQSTKERTKELDIPTSVVFETSSSPVAGSATEGTFSDMSGAFGRNVLITGNRIDLASQEASPSQGTRVKEETGSSSRSSRHLKGAWLHYWEQFVGRGEGNDSFHLSQMRLQTFTGHSAGIKALQVMPNESSFASASRDKTVKLWSLRNYGDGTSNVSCQFSYPHHKKTVFALNYLESQRLIASCDGNVYVWDPYGSGAALRGYDLSKNVPTCMVAMPAPSPVLIVSTPDATVQIIDIRHANVQHELRVSAGPLGLIRCLSVSPDGSTLGVGLSSGVLSLVDLRTGLLLGGWRAHDGEILQVKSHTNRSFLTSSVDSSMTLWREDSTKICSFRGLPEPVSFLSLSNNQVISATTSCRIGLHTSISEQANYSSTKVRSDVFKGVVSAMDVLPLNKLFLIGSDNGSITLMA